MGKAKKMGLIASALVCTFLFSQGTCVYASEDTKASNAVIVTDNTRIQDDFYNAVNKDWLNSAKIAVGKTSNSTFMEAEEKTTEQKKEIINDLLADEKSYSENSDEKKIINLYKNTLNMDERNKQGIEPIKEIINEVNNIKSVKDIKDLNIDSKISSPLIGIGCDADLKDAKHHALYISPSSLSLSDSDDYTKPTEYSNKVKGLVETYYTKVLKLSGYDENVSKEKVDNLFKFEGMVAAYIKGSEETTKDDNSIDEQYNVYTLDELNNLAPNIDLKTIAKNFKVDNANKIILEQPKWLEGLNSLYTDDNLQLIKDYLEIHNVVSCSRYLGQEFQDAYTEYKNAYTGSTGDITVEEKAVNMVNSALGEPFGKIYIDKYFSDKVKKDVTDITDEIISTYKDRINNLDWMSDTTKAKAVEKLSKITPKIAYPDKWEDYSDLEIKSFEDGSSLYENIKNLNKFSYEKSVKELNETVDKTKFACEPQMVNAFYDPCTNSITVPAGILQGGFYDIDATKEQNLGSIGAIIGHEISHAFDNSGAKFDADGNLNNWWTEDDYNKFQDKVNKVKAFYSTVKTDNGENVNGDLTVGENIADIGGMACVIDILNKLPNPNYKEFFESNSKVWRQISTDEYTEILLKYDEHSPNKVRSNIVVAQFEEFYKTYGVKEADKMYIKPEDRLQIW